MDRWVSPLSLKILEPPMGIAWVTMLFCSVPGSLNSPGHQYSQWEYAIMSNVWEIIDSR